MAAPAIVAPSGSNVIRDEVLVPAATHWLVVSAALVVGGTGCLADHPTSDLGVEVAPLGAFTVSVAPFSLPMMTDGCFSLTVYSTDDPALFDAAHTVWTEPSLCASQYGSTSGVGSGSMAFTGVCDAQAAGPEHRNSVRLVLNDLYTGGPAGGGGVILSPAYYVNPCPAGGNDCVLSAPCSESADSSVAFDLVVAANANLGLVDASVKFADIWCAAKLDCVDGEGATLDYLHDPTGGHDGPTAVLGFACTGGATVAETHLYLEDLVVTCDNGWTATLDPSLDLGHAAADDPHGIFFATDVDRGDGARASQYWNVLLGLDLDAVAAAGTCTLSTWGTATESAICQTPDQSRYPIIHWDVPLTTDGQRACGRHRLGGADGAVRTVYTALTEPVALPCPLATP